ncbi:hypothetical protein A2303_02625 [Candidatus Falkowbacteria bacterium RIFOXYB2_FULL_47_14]|uniref:Uncharacterized protein n=1 Tax=Candidatus Falkowbacteria bacterium RIFOXYA2_FULL_47_19 TaxID=1797994 RepID=A0A1F5SGY6_9BACT|nr:MAG: hypothetical protein A2227_05810 [Candidatus Falkowbacteria bacterium RIFOXYA2_FULL_47_19]OGF34528.1 MAG: hypothetical protein A2468_04850 [Candidatus Falkowbacteria bacterium RIFOXYC2_FULL_46_15]OGF43017.1 MAG: hypothetical protein A2303_02625 [Candidatus Falkowbacteria bacterium RIFOXYB2_FULL_47_14]
MKNLRKALTVGVMSVTVLSMSMLAVPFTVGAVAQAGDLIKMDGLSSVYFLAADGKRYVFPNEATYFSWYSDFSGVVTIPQSELESYPLGANVTMRPGTKLVKITTNPKVYAVLPGGVLTPVPSEAVASALYGADWNKRIVDVPDAFFTNYTVSTAEVSATAYPAGSLVKFGTGADVYYINTDGTASKVADEAAFMANRFSWDNVISSDLTLPTLGTAIAAANASLTDTSEGAGGTAGAGTGLTVSLASDTPAAGNIPAGSPTEFLKLKFTASADGAVNVNAITLSAYDLGTATYIDNVTFYDEAGAKIGTAKDMNSDRVAAFNFSSPISVPAGSTKTVTVKATIEAGKSGNYAIGLSGAANVITNGAAVSGSFPIVGNTKVIVTGTNIGTVTMAAPIGSGAVSAQFGEDDVLLASFNLTAANEPVIWESASFRNGGTNNANIASNFRLLIDGDEKATVASIVDKYVTFDLDSFVIAKGDSIAVEVYGDMGISNVNDEVNLYVYNASDFVFTGQDFGYGILPTIHADLDADTEGYVVSLASGDFTIDMDKTATPAKEVRGGDNDVVIATVKMTSNGENATMATFGDDAFYINGTGLICDADYPEIENAEMRDTSTGVVYDLTIATGTTGCSLTGADELSFVKGVTRTFQIRVDLAGATDVNPIEGDDTLQVTLGSAAINGLTGDESDASITNITPSSVSGSIITVKASSLTWTTTSLTAKTIVPGAQDVVVYKASLEAGDSSYIDLTSLTVDVLTDTGDYTGSFVDLNVAQLQLLLDGKVLKTLSNQIADDTDGTATDNYIAFTSLDATNRRIAAGATVNLEIVADFAASFSTTSTFTLTVEDNSKMVSRDMDSNAVDETVSNGSAASRALTLASVGTIKVELNTDEIKASSDTYILAGQSTTKDRYLGELVFTTTNEPIKVKTLKLDLSDNAGINAKNSDIKTLNLYDDDGVLVASKAPDASGDVNFDTFNRIFPADQATSLWIGVTTKTINADGDPEGTATYNHGAEYTLGRTAAFTAEGGNSGTSITVSAATSGTVGTNQWDSWEFATSSQTNITGSVLNSVVNTLADGVLTGGNGKTVGKYKFVFDNGTNRATSTNETTKAQMRQLILTFATSSVAVTGNVKAYVEGLSSVQTAAGTYSAAASTYTIDLTGLGNTALVDGEVTLVIIADLGSAGTNAFIQTEINSLAADFTYNGDSGIWPDHFSNARLSISEVLGGTLSN